MIKNLRLMMTMMLLAVIGSALAQEKTSVELKFDTDGYMTYVTENAIDWTKTLEKDDGIHGYKVVNFSLESGVSLVEFGKDNVATVPIKDKTYHESAIPAGTPIIIMGKTGVHSLVISDAKDIQAPAGNLLRASTGKETTTDKEILYVLQRKDKNGSGLENYSFFRLRANRYIPVGKAFLSSTDMNLEGDESSLTGDAIFPPIFGVKVIGQEGGDSAVGDDAGIIDGINVVPQVANGENVFYSVSGVRVDNPSKGIYIVNGKKVMLK
jgi:hypothetical protein